MQAKLSKYQTDAEAQMQPAPKKVMKARPSCQPTQEEIIKQSVQLKYRKIDDWNRKLTHMYTILTATEGLEQMGQHFDEFEKAFQQCRENLHKSKDLIMKRAEIFKEKGSNDYKVISKSTLIHVN